MPWRCRRFTKSLKHFYKNKRKSYFLIKKKITEHTVHLSGDRKIIFHGFSKQ